MLFKHELNVLGNLFLTKAINFLARIYLSIAELHLKNYSLSLSFTLFFELSFFFLWTLYLWSGINGTTLFLGDEIGVFCVVAGKIIG